MTRHEARALNSLTEATLYSPGETVVVCFTGPDATQTALSELTNALGEISFGSVEIETGFCTTPAGADAVSVCLISAANPQFTQLGSTGLAMSGKGARLDPEEFEEISGAWDERSDIQVVTVWDDDAQSYAQAKANFRHEFSLALGLVQELEPGCTGTANPNGVALTSDDPTAWREARIASQASGRNSTY